MSLFDYPRINIKGIISFSPSTANNDDYAGAANLPSDWGPFAGQTLALVDSKNVEARTYGMSDEAFIEWAQKTQTFDNANSPGQTMELIPAEWNYYGALDYNVPSAKVIGVQNAPKKVYTKINKQVKISSIIGANLTVSGHFADVNTQGSPPGTQFFIDSLSLTKGKQTLLSGSASKAPSIWLNFYRNVNLTADGGAGAYAYHIMKKTDEGAVFNLPGFQDAKVIGAIFRYYLYRPIIGGGSQTNADIEAIYKSKGTNPAELEISGTFAPLYADEEIVSMPTGRLMVSNIANIQTPPGSRNNSNGYIALAPAVLQQNGNVITVDFSGTFPDYYQNGANPKYDFGPVSLQVSNSKETAVIDTVDYANTEAGDSKGWLFDFDISSNKAALRVLKDKNASFKLVQTYLGTVLEETDYYFVSNQMAIYTEQFGTGTEFINQGTYEPATLKVFSRGKELKGKACPPITVWQYRSIPLEAPGDAVAIHNNFKPGQALEVDTSQPGNFLFTFSINSKDNPPPNGYPPASYSTFMNPPYITNAPSISLRILPNGEDFSSYYHNDPETGKYIGDDNLTFDFVYRKVLRTYYLLYPAMNQVIPLNDEKMVAKYASAIIDRTSPGIWMQSGFMPRTRDMSASRRDLLHAWCRKVMVKRT